MDISSPGSWCTAVFGSPHYRFDSTQLPRRCHCNTPTSQALLNPTHPGRSDHCMTLGTPLSWSSLVASDCGVCSLRVQLHWFYKREMGICLLFGEVLIKFNFKSWRTKIAFAHRLFRANMSIISVLGMFRTHLVIFDLSPVRCWLQLTEIVEYFSSMEKMGDAFSLKVFCETVESVAESNFQITRRCKSPVK